MSRASRPRRVLHARDRLALFDAYFPARIVALSLDGPSGSAAFRRAAKCLTRPSILRGAVLGQRVSARAAARLLASLGAT